MARKRKLMIQVVEEDTDYHYESNGRPLCGITSVGTYVVEQPRHVNCVACRAVLSRINQGTRQAVN